MNDEFTHSVYWNEYQTMSETNIKLINNKINIYKVLSESLQSVRRLLVLAYDAWTADDESVTISKK